MVNGLFSGAGDDNDKIKKKVRNDDAELAMLIRILAVGPEAMKVKDILEGKFHFQILILFSNHFHAYNMIRKTIRTLELGLHLAPPQV